MASNYTTNYQLNQWEAGDQVLRTEFNQDNQKIDTALKNQADSIAALETILDGLLNCRVYTFQYTGTGLTGRENFWQMTFPAKPALLVIFGDEKLFFYLPLDGERGMIWSGTYLWSWTPTWSGNTASFPGAGSGDMTMNQLNKTYRGLAFYQV